METKKVEFAPDYESKKRDVTVALTGVQAKAVPGDVTAMNSYDPVGLLSEQTSIDKRVIHARLQAAVVASAKTWRQEFGGNIHLEALATTALAQDVDALIAFEAEHKIGE